MDKTYKRTVLDSNGVERTEVISQQKLASQLPRGTRLNKTGTQLEIKGARNYTSRPLQVGPHEIYEDIVERGLRADGLSTKLGVKNNKDSVAKLVQSLLHGDRLAETMQHYRTKRQRNNCAKNIFATMTNEELKIIKAEMFPTRIDVQIRNCLRDIYAEQPEKIHSTIDVLKNIQNTFKQLAPHAELLSTHNYQTRGFFVDVLVMMSSFIIQIIEDVNSFNETNEVLEAVSGMQDDYNDIKQDTTAAEILLSVGSDIQRMEMPPNTFDSHSQVTQNLDGSMKENTIFVENGDKEISGDTIITSDSKNFNDDCKQWTTVEMTDNDGQKKYFLVRNPNDGNMDTNKFLEILQSETGSNLNSNSEQPYQFINSDNIIQESGNYDVESNLTDIATFEKLNSNASADKEQNHYLTGLPTAQKGDELVLQSCDTLNINTDTTAKPTDLSNDPLTIAITTGEPPMKKSKIKSHKIVPR